MSTRCWCSPQGRWFMRSPAGLVKKPDCLVGPDRHLWWICCFFICVSWSKKSILEGITGITCFGGVGDDVRGSQVRRWRHGTAHLQGLSMETAGWTYGMGDESFLSMGMSTYRGEVKSVVKSCDFPMSPAVLSLFWWRIFDGTGLLIHWVIWWHISSPRGRCSGR